MQLGQFSAVITVEEDPLPEYAVEYSADGMEATCWIASENDKEFCIKMTDTDTSPNRTISGRVSVDGTKCGGRHLSLKPGSNVCTADRDSISTSANTRRLLTFGKQILTDDDEYLHTAISPDLGTIKVVFNLVKPRARARSKTSYLRPEAKILHERSKKAMGHSVQFGPEFYHQNRFSAGKSKTIKSLATLVFRYRPLELLRAEGIAPPAVRPARAAIPDPTDVVDLTMDVDDDNDEVEMKQLEMRLNALKNKNNKKKQVKREPSDVKEIKSELTFTPGEVIDLT
ncbi:hypothetical protein MVEN_02143800 [Mycena venus]|uniref:DUF7918 domain-containing protein n=1 Tax=Mycena venus TaxID=2733690 RepID=A0A8H6XAN3_9AGAR|nr:hypothetical protein MVEN_02143800 [Mycena venus]